MTKLKQILFCTVIALFSCGIHEQIQISSDIIFDWSDEELEVEKCDKGCISIVCYKSVFDIDLKRSFEINGVLVSIKSYPVIGKSGKWQKILESFFFDPLNDKYSMKVTELDSTIKDIVVFGDSVAIRVRKELNYDDLFVIPFKEILSDTLRLREPTTIPKECELFTENNRLWYFREFSSRYDFFMKSTNHFHAGTIDGVSEDMELYVNLEGQLYALVQDTSYFVRNKCIWDSQTVSTSRIFVLDDEASKLKLIDVCGSVYDLYGNSFATGFLVEFNNCKNLSPTISKILDNETSIIENTPVFSPLVKFDGFWLNYCEFEMSCGQGWKLFDF